MKSEIPNNLIEAAPALLEALKDIISCRSIRGPAGATAYIISDTRMEAAVIAVLEAEGKWSYLERYESDYERQDPIPIFFPFKNEEVK